MLHQRLLGSADSLQRIIDIIPSPVFIKDENHKWILLNDAATRLLGGTREELLGRSDYDIFPPAQATLSWASDDEVLATGLMVESEECFTLPASGYTHTMIMRKTLLHVPPGRRFLVGVASDVTEYRNAVAENHFLSRHDGLTGLPNRVLFHETLNDAVSHGQRALDNIAVLLVDLDGFKSVNDAYGHEAGDELLRVVAGRLKGCVRNTDLVARLGGDEFGVLLRGGPALRQAAERVATNICGAIAAPVILTQTQTRISASVGITYFNNTDIRPEELIRQADLAMYSVKRSGRHGHKTYEPALEATANRQLHADLLHALARQELHVAYQPLWNPPDGLLTGYEALLRWQHAHFGDIPPRIFIPIAEQSGLISTFGAYVLRAACAAACNWPEQVRLCVNISPIQLADRQFAATVNQALADSGLAPNRLELEVTESRLTLDHEDALRQLHLLKEEGVQVAVDDFGTGAASLDMMHRFGLNRMKIDRRFISGLPADQRGYAIVRALIRLAHDLGAKVTAEGVEHMEQALCLMELGCDEMQGYLFGHPEAPQSILTSTEAPLPAMP
ncbi:MAG: EAL domain-containing protein [Rhodospirillales bacterium]|nr:EAL domain-containing protein [Rhodospirillales bacterium]